MSQIQQATAPGAADSSTALIRIWGGGSPRYKAFQDGVEKAIEIAAQQGQQQGLQAATATVTTDCATAVDPADYHALVHSSCADTLLSDVAYIWSDGATGGQSPEQKYGEGSDHFKQIELFMESIDAGFGSNGLLQGLADSAAQADQACASGTPEANAALSNGATVEPSQPSASPTTNASGPVATAGVANADDNACVNSFDSLLDEHSGLTQDQALAAAPNTETRSILSRAFARRDQDLTATDPTTYWSNASARDDAASLFNGYCAAHADIHAVFPHYGPAGSKDCGADEQGGEIYANHRASCPFAKAVAAAWWQEQALASPEYPPTQVFAHSPVTGKDYTLQCTAPPSMQCTTDDGATVYLGM